MTPEEIHQLAIEIYEALNNEGAELGKSFSDTIERTIEEFLYEPKCFYCHNKSYVEGWVRYDDLGVIRKTPVCEEHMYKLIGYKKEG